MNSTSMEEWFKHVKPHQSHTLAIICRPLKCCVSWNIIFEMVSAETLTWNFLRLSQRVGEGWCLANSRLKHTSDPSISASNWNIHVGETIQATRVLWIHIVTSCCISLVYKRHKKGSERMSASSHINSSKIVVDGTNDMERAYEWIETNPRKTFIVERKWRGAEVNAKMNRWASECRCMEENNKNLWSWLEMRIAYRIFIN